MPETTTAAAPPAAVKRRAAPLTQSRDKMFYSISEAAAQLDVAAHVLRYWESQFTMLRPRKNRAGSRIYQPRDIDMLQMIKTLLYDEGMTIAGARRKLQAARRALGAPSAEAGENGAQAPDTPRPPSPVPATVRARGGAAATPSPSLSRLAVASSQGAGAIADAAQASLPFAGVAAGRPPGLSSELAAVREALRELAASLQVPRTRRMAPR